MGNNNDKTVVADIDKDFLRRKTSITENDLGMYDNFLSQHPDGEIARKEFRFIFLIFYISWQKIMRGQRMQLYILIRAVLYFLW